MYKIVFLLSLTTASNALSLNETQKINNYSITLEKIENIEKNNFQELVASFSIMKKNSTIANLNPSKRYYYVSKTITTEVDIFHDWFRDFYIILGDEKNNQWNTKIYLNPMVSLIWIGVIIMIFSGLMGIKKR